jgi:MFS family permease
LPNITADLNAPPIATTLTAALFVLAMGIAPVFWASFSDYYQVRRILLILSMLIFGAASIGEAFINNIWALVVLRCVQSVGSSCGQSVGAGKYLHVLGGGVTKKKKKKTTKMENFFFFFFLRHYCCKFDKKVCTKS